MRQWFADETEFDDRGKLIWQTGKRNDRFGNGCGNKATEVVCSLVPPLPSSPRRQKLLPLNEVFHDLQEFIVQEGAFELVRGIRFRRRRRVVRVAVYVEVVRLLGVLVGELVLHLLFVQRHLFAGL